MAARLTLQGVPGAWGRRAAWCAVVVAVVLAHGWVTRQVAESSLGWGAAARAVQRFDVAFVRELQPAAPPAVAPRPRPKPTPRVVASAEPAASQPPAGEPEPAGPVPQPSAAEPALSAAESLAVAELPAPAVMPAEPAASAPANVAFEWPPSTRLNYSITGHYDGPVEGSARVQWIRIGSRYQVQMDTRVALVATRLATSDGELTERGLRPRRYDEQTRFLGSERHASVLFEDDRVVLADGRSLPRPDGVQDTASQLVQLVWLFTTQPERLAPGQSVELPVALPRRLDTWIFDVLEAEAVQTAFGEVPSWHVKPRRSAAKPGNVLTVECWFAPSLQYLPVRLKIRQNETNYLDLLLEAPPLQAAPDG
jgi:hypothetical protein